MKKPITEEMRDKLNYPFPAKAYSKHPTKTYLTTVKAIYIVERLNDVFGIGRWALDHEVVQVTEEQVLMVGELKLLDYPEHKITAQYGSHTIVGKGVELADGYKSAVTDCLSKCASYLEIAIDIYKGNKVPEENYKPLKKETDPLIDVFLIDAVSKCPTLEQLKSIGATIRALGVINKYTEILTKRHKEIIKEIAIINNKTSVKS